MNKLCDVGPVTWPVHASLTSTTKWRQSQLLCYDQCRRSRCIRGTLVMIQRATGLSDTILAGMGRGGSEPWRPLGFLTPGIGASHIQLLASFCSSNYIPCICAHLRLPFVLALEWKLIMNAYVATVAF